MKKLKLLVVKPNDNKKTIIKNLIKYLEQQGIKIIKGGKNEEQNFSTQERFIS